LVEGLARILAVPPKAQAAQFRYAPSVKLSVKLTTKGRRTGKPRQVSLYAFEDGDRLVVVGSRGGAAADPDWAGNLRVEPQATIKIGRDARDVCAHEVAGSERDRLWTLVTGEFPLYASYQRKTERVIPLFVLETVGCA
jgi:deazaflavin-dependent oxidoreductase (nitroreductase family)